jgi:hypothetical protein
MHFANNPPPKAPAINTGTRFRRSHGPVSVAAIWCMLAVRPQVNVAPAGGHRSQLPRRRPIYSITIMLSELEQRVLYYSSCVTHVIALFFGEMYS